MRECAFCKIVDRKLQANIIYEDDHCLAFDDTNPQAPIHFLVIPKEHIETIIDANETILGRLFYRASRLAESKGLDKNGFRTVINCKRHAGQTVYHLHLHVMGGRWFIWPPG